MGRKVPYETRRLWSDKVRWAEVYEDFMEARDPTGYQFVQRCKHIECWDHWEYVLASPYCRPDVDKWQRELAVKLRSEGVREIFSLANSEKGNFQAAKYMADKGWSPKRGRPSKAEVEGAKKEEAGLQQEIDTIFETSQGKTAH